MEAKTLSVLGLLCFLVGVNAHMSIFVPSMWGSEPDNINSNYMCNPLQDLDFSQWWMHGPKALADAPAATAITELPAGGTIDLEIGGNKAFTTMGRGLWHPDGKSSRVPGEPFPGGWPSNIHASGLADVAGCALAIAYKSDVNTVKPEDFVVFSVVKQCPAPALQAHDVPYLPACPNGKCICAWFWIHNSDGGTDQMYMSPFQCNVSNPSKRVIGKPVPAIRCDGKPTCYLYPNWGNTTTTCNKVQQPMYWANNQGNNMKNPTNSQCAPIYSAQYGYFDGAQHQIFVDDFKCIENVGDTLSSHPNATYPAYITSSPSTTLVTPGCGTKLNVMDDGTIVLASVSSGKTLWASNTSGKGVGPYRLVIQNDGNLVLIDSKSSSIWTSTTSGTGCAPYSLKIRDVGKLTLVDCNGEPLWAAKTQ